MPPEPAELPEAHSLVKPQPFELPAFKSDTWTDELIQAFDFPEEENKQLSKEEEDVIIGANQAAATQTTKKGKNEGKKEEKETCVLF